MSSWKVMANTGSTGLIGVPIGTARIFHEVPNCQLFFEDPNAFRAPLTLPSIMSADFGRLPTTPGRPSAAHHPDRAGYIFMMWSAIRAGPRESDKLAARV